MPRFRLLLLELREQVVVEVASAIPSQPRRTHWIRVGYFQELLQKVTKKTPQPEVVIKFTLEGLDLYGAKSSKT